MYVVQVLQTKPRKRWMNGNPTLELLHESALTSPSYVHSDS